MAAKVDPIQCVGCGACEGVCPVEAITLPEGLAVVDADACIDCGTCVNVCPNGAISLED